MKKLQIPTKSKRLIQLKSNFKFALVLALGVTITSSFSQTQKGSNLTGEASGDLFGTSVSMSTDGNTLAIGSPANNSTGASAGQVQIYTWSGTTWEQKGLDINGEATSDQSGKAVSLSADGDLIAIGAHFNADNGTKSGHVRVYAWSGSAWVQQGADIDGEAAYDQSGSSVSLSSDGSTLAIGAPFNGGTGTNAGHARIYVWNGSAWTQRGLDINAETSGDQCGYSVSLNDDGTTVAISSPSNDDNGALSGQARIFDWSGTAWTQRGLDIDGEAADDLAGYSVSLSADGNTVAIGSHRSHDGGNDAGHVRVFTWSGSTWTQKGINVPGTKGFGNFGTSVELSDDGNIIVASAPYHSIGTYAFEGTARVFKWSGSAWVQEGTTINGINDNDHLGSSVAISGDGTTIALGTPDAGSNGVTYVYTMAVLSSVTGNSTNQIKISPNPFNNSFELNGSFNNTEYSILDINSKVIQNGILTETSNRITLNVASGMYYLKIGESVHKIIKE